MKATDTPELIKALAHPARLEILKILIRSEFPLKVDPLFDQMITKPLSYPSRVFHLSTLREVGLVRTHMIDGRQISLQPNITLINSLLGFLTEYLKEADHQ